MSFQNHGKSGFVPLSAVVGFQYVAQSVSSPLSLPSPPSSLPSPSSLSSRAQWTDFEPKTSRIPLEFRSKAVVARFEGQDHTLGQMLREQLLATQGVREVGLLVDDEDEIFLDLRIHTAQNTCPKRAVDEAAARLSAHLGELHGAIREAMIRAYPAADIGEEGSKGKGECKGKGKGKGKSECASECASEFGGAAATDRDDIQDDIEDDLASCLQAAETARIAECEQQGEQQGDERQGDEKQDKEPQDKEQQEQQQQDKEQQDADQQDDEQRDNDTAKTADEAKEHKQEGKEEDGDHDDGAEDDGANDDHAAKEDGAKEDDGADAKEDDADDDKHSYFAYPPLPANCFACQRPLACWSETWTAWLLRRCELSGRVSDAEVAQQEDQVLSGTMGMAHGCCRQLFLAQQLESVARGAMWETASGQTGQSAEDAKDIPVASAAPSAAPAQRAAARHADTEEAASASKPKPSTSKKPRDGAKSRAKPIAASDGAAAPSGKILTQQQRPPNAFGLLPMRCFTCLKSLSNWSETWEEWLRRRVELVVSDGELARQQDLVLRRMGMTRDCCRCAFLTQPVVALPHLPLRPLRPSASPLRPLRPSASPPPPSCQSQRPDLK